MFPLLNEFARVPVCGLIARYNELPASGRGRLGCRPDRAHQGRWPGRYRRKPDKCAFVRNELGFDAVVDHHAEDFDLQLMADCPNGIDVYFANVGGHASIGCRMPCRGRNLLTPGTLEPG
ncbi:hypothetical protein [Mesorhizobium sp.]|uniref:hypothetical protein n=1 Tax=Mesorhizobium sp. TaxID=1871066 RepID=UPI0025CE84B6|nr:hypothetical protein [Mesorhizobium sp.]